MAYPLLTADQRNMVRVATEFLDKHLFVDSEHFRFVNPTLAAIPDQRGVQLSLTSRIGEHTLVSRALISPCDSTATIYEKVEQVVTGMLRLVCIMKPN